jgi:uridine phosphorylase
MAKAKTRRPHLTPSKLIGERFEPNFFKPARIALVGYCPPPATLLRYQPQKLKKQPFIHVPAESASTFQCGGISFLSLTHVYGGPVSASTVEELAYFQFDYILAYGLAGGLGTKGLKMGDFYLVESARVADGTTPHYTREKIVRCDRSLKVAALKHAPLTPLAGVKSVRAITGDAIYRETDRYLDRARNQGCDIVNLDTSHLYAVARHNHSGRIVKTIECGVISDVTEGKGKEWKSTLSTVLTSEKTEGVNPLELTGKIVEWYVERLAPALI